MVKFIVVCNEEDVIGFGKTEQLALNSAEEYIDDMYEGDAANLDFSLYELKTDLEVKSQKTTLVPKGKK